MLLKLPVGLFRVWPVFLNMCLIITLKSIIQDHWFWSLLYLLMQSFLKVQRTTVKCCKIWRLRWNTGNIRNYIVILKTWNLRQTCCLNYETIFLLDRYFPKSWVILKITFGQFYEVHFTATCFMGSCLHRDFVHRAIFLFQIV